MCLNSRGANKCAPAGSRRPAVPPGTGRPASAPGGTASAPPVAHRQGKVKRSQPPLQHARGCAGQQQDPVLCCAVFQHLQIQAALSARM